MSIFEGHWKLQYSDTVADLAGHQTQSFLKELCTMDSKTGEIVLFDVIEPDDEGDFNLMSTDTNHRMDFEEIATPVLDDFLALQTPHMNVLKDKVLCAPYENVWGHTFRNIDEVAENANKQSDVLRQGMKKIFKNQDSWILDALSRSTEQRGKDPAAAVPVAFPASQQINEADGVFDLETLSAIAEKFDQNYLHGEKICCVISPAAKKSLIDNSGGTIHSSDFVDGYSDFANGELPQIYGISLIVHPLVTDYSGTYPDAFFAWNPSAIVYNQFEALSTEIDKAPTQKFNVILMIQEYVGACRRDDLAVVQGTLGTAV